MNKLAAICAALFIFAAAPCYAAEEITIEGGGAALSHVFFPMKESFEKSTGFTLTLKYTTPGRGLVSVARGTADATTAAAPLETIIAGAEAEGVDIDPSSLRVVEMGKSRVIVMLHKSNHVASLDKGQLKDLFSGKTTNWKQVGGADLPVVVVWGKDTPGQNSLFARTILDDGPVAANARRVSDYRSIRDMVAATPGAIGINPQGFISANVNVPQTPVLAAPIIFVTAGAPSEKVQKLIRFYDEEFAFLQQ